MSDCFDSDSTRMTRSMSLLSNAAEDEEESMNLLAEGNAGHESLPGQVVIDESAMSMVARSLKRAMEPVMTELREVKKQNMVLDRKVSTVIQKNENLEKMLKEIAAKNQKAVEDVECLLTSDGIKFLKSMLFRNLDMKAKDAEEVTLLNRFMTRAKEEGWLIKSSAKSEKDIIQYFRTKRNYLKAQIRLRVFEDMSNKTPEQISQLQISMKFIRETLGVTELGDDYQRIIYNFAFTHYKYLNSAVNVSTLTTADKKNRAKATEDPWAYVMCRVEADRSARRGYKVIMDRFVELVQSGQNYVPL